MPRTTHRPGNVPAETTSFVGRRHELAEIRKKLAAARLVSLVGPGGVGKTRLAIRTAISLGRGFPGGVWMAELAELRDPALVGNAVMTALDLRDQAATEPPALLRTYLKDKELLLIVDNCEHLLEAAAQLIGEVIRAAPGVRVIATSREPLSVAGEHVLPVPPLDLPAAGHLAQLRQNEAVTLFVERAAAASGRFELTASNQAAVVGVCRRLDGLPLAIELAAVRTRALGPEQIHDRLSDRFGLLTGGSRTALVRHQTLRTTIEWSHDLLTPAERTLLARLCVFAGRFTLEDVESVCCAGEVPAAHALDLLSSLIDKSLVIKEDAAGAACYRLHETMREYARLKLREQGDEDALELRCAEHYLSRCARFATEGRYRLPEWLAWAELEIDNIRAVLRRCLDHDDVGRGIDLATFLIWFWITRATAEGVRWLGELLVREAGPSAHPWAYFVRGFLSVLQNDPAGAMPALERGVTAARTAQQREVLSQSLAMASIAADMAGDRASSKRLFDEAQAVADGLDDLGTTLMMYQAQALNGLLDGDLDAVRSATSQGVRLSRAAGDLYSLDMMLLNQGFAALISGDFRAAEERFTEGLRIAHQLDDRVAQCHLLGALGCCAIGSRDPGLAARLFGAMENLRAEVAAGINAGMAPVLAQATKSAEAALGRSKFEAEFEAGKRLSRDTAARLALGDAARPDLAASARGSAGILRQREADVARLVADGLSNKEIGVRLFISERTVESHVRSIMNKLGFNSRAQIAGWIATSDL
ncbi:LuxR C-terminal-related transcriptional regulator [Actinomadura sp. DC4]|uniref:helix-turn-helix transcriptional regulator n=1 Tax=Actinomadura sp. DC4 TaxID=3055069 RepID=UPI0025B1AC13|nr:LuxR C-terminal-related transcriptional regulator [Actinomadura sp. DC4]MDN3355617.1 LuxR C-terminal-related transcriptional regulator [Actinomadura sp. DC4]